ncbi:MAG: hypothetical protein LBU57_08440, partial [Dysgonamonadaceae bacterium]|jgi:hypothetical protein|nr:hypothetical protein [Dysgonamonadaceae bacterium]
LFINQIATPENTSVEISEESLVQTHLDGFGMWRESRLCLSTTQKYYKRGPVAFWRFESYSKVFFWIAVACLFIHGWPHPLLPAIASGLFLIRFLIQLFVINKTCKLLRVERFYFTLLLFDFFQPFFDVYITVCRLLRGKKDYIWRY